MPRTAHDRAAVDRRTRAGAAAPLDRGRRRAIRTLDLADAARRGVATEALSVRWARRARDARQRRAPAAPALAARAGRVRARLDSVGDGGIRTFQSGILPFAALSRGWSEHRSARLPRRDAATGRRACRLAALHLALGGGFHHGDQADVARRAASRTRAVRPPVLGLRGRMRSDRRGVARVSPLVRTRASPQDRGCAGAAWLDRASGGLRADPDAGDSGRGEGAALRRIRERGRWRRQGHHLRFLVELAASRTLRRAAWLLQGSARIFSASRAWQTMTVPVDS